MKTVAVYTDGACRGNPGPGGWAALRRYGGHEKILTGPEPETANNTATSSTVAGHRICVPLLAR